MSNLKNLSKMYTAFVYIFVAFRGVCWRNHVTSWGCLRKEGVPPVWFVCGRRSRQLCGVDSRSNPVQSKDREKEATVPRERDGRWITVNGLWSLQVWALLSAVVVSFVCWGKVEETKAAPLMASSRSCSTMLQLYRKKRVVLWEFWPFRVLGGGIIE